MLRFQIRAKSRGFEAGPNLGGFAGMIHQICPMRLIPLRVLSSEPCGSLRTLAEKIFFYGYWNSNEDGLIKIFFYGYWNTEDGFFFNSHLIRIRMVFMIYSIQRSSMAAKGFIKMGFPFPWRPTGTRTTQVSLWKKVYSLRLKPWPWLHSWLVGGNWLPLGLFSHYDWECHHPNWRTHIFQRGGWTTNQLM